VSRLCRGFAAALLAGAAALALAGDVVVLKGGTVIPLKQPVVRRGNTAYITRADGTLLSVPSSEIDRDATAAANSAVPAPAPKQEVQAASTPAGAVREAKEGPKARVRITDADVSHPLEMEPGTAGDKDKDKKEQGPGYPKVEVADYTRQMNGASLVLKGTVRNVGQGAAENVRMTVTAFDEKGQSIDGANANLSGGTVDPGTSVEFNASLNVGDKTVASLRFQPQWTSPPPPAPPPPRPGTAAAAAAAAANKPPAPAPTPYGRGTLYAAPVASAPTEAPADGKTGYIPGASHPDNQPKPPVP
jgi:hypothetical protein